jgi:hypothetical protein
MEISLNKAAIEAVLGNIGTIHQPGQSVGGSILVNQDWAKSLPNRVEVTLLSFELKDMPTQRQQTRYDADGNRTVLPNANSMQAPGIATIQVGDEKQQVKMHLPVAAALALVGGKGTANIQKGEILNGRNKGSIWVSLSVDNPCEGEALKAWIEAQMKEQATKKPTV